MKRNQAARSGRTAAEAKPAVALSEWYLKPVLLQGALCLAVEGIRCDTAAGAHRGHLWHSSNINGRYQDNPRLVQTHSGNVYELSGPMTKNPLILSALHARGFVPEILDQFKSGFPHNWKGLLQMVDQKRKIMTEAAAAAAAALQQEAGNGLLPVPGHHATNGNESVNDANVSMDVSGQQEESPAATNAERKSRAVAGNETNERKNEASSREKQGSSSKTATAAGSEPHGVRVKISHDDSSTAAGKGRGGAKTKKNEERDEEEEAEEEAEAEPVLLDGKVIAEMTRIELLKGLRARGKKKASGTRGQLAAMLERLVVAETVPQPQPQPQRDSPKTSKKADSIPMAAAAKQKVDKEPTESTTTPPPVAEELTQEKTDVEAALPQPQGQPSSIEGQPQQQSEAPEASTSVLGDIGSEDPKQAETPPVLEPMQQNADEPKKEVLRADDADLRPEAQLPQLQPSEAPQPQPLDVPLLFPQRDDNVDRNEQQQQQQVTEQPPEEVMMEVVELVSETTASMMIDGASPPQVEPYDSPTLELSSSSPCLSPSPPPRSPMSPVMASLSAPPDESGEAPAYWLSGVPHISIIPAALAFQLDAGALPPAANDSTSTAGALAAESSESLSAAAAVVETAAATILADVGAELEKIAAESAPGGVPAEDKERPLPLTASSMTAEAPGEQPPKAEPQHEPEQPQEQPQAPAEVTSGQEEHAAATAVEGSRQEEETTTEAGKEEKRTTTEGEAGEEAEEVATKTPSAADHPVEVQTEETKTEVEAEAEAEAEAEVRAKEEEEEEQPEEPFQHLDLLKRDEIVVELQKLGLPCRGKKPQILNRLKAALAARAAPEEAGKEELDQQQGEAAGAEETMSVAQPPEDEQPLSPVQPELEPESEPESEPIVATVDESERKSEDDKRTKRDRRWSDAMEEDEGEEEEEEETDTKTRKRRKQQKEEEGGDERAKLRDESRISKHRKKLEQNERRRIRSNQPATRPWSDPEELTRDEIAIELKKRNYPSNGARNALVRRLAYVMAVERGEEDPLAIPPEDCELMTKDQLATALAKRGFDNAGPIAKLRQRLQKGIAWAAALVSPGATSPRTAAESEDASKPEPEEEPEEPKTIAVAKRRRVSEDSEDGDKKKRKLSKPDSNNNNNNKNDERKPERVAEAESDGEEKQGEHGEGDEEHEDFEAEIENLMREAKEKGQRGKKRTSGSMYASDSLDEDEGGAGDDNGDGDSVRHHKQQTKQKSSKLHKKVKLEDQTSTTPRGARDEKKEADEKELKKKKEEERQRRAEERMKRREADRLRREEEIIQKRVMMLATTTGEQHARLAADDLDGMDDDLAGQSGAEELDELSTSTMSAMANSGDGSGGEEGVRSTPTKGGRGRRKSGGGKKSRAIKREEEEEELEDMELVYGRDNLEKLNTKILILQSKMRGLPTQKRRKIDMVNRIANFDDRQAAGEGQTATTETAGTTAVDDAKPSGEQEALVDQQSVITDIAIDDDVILTSTAREPYSAPDEHDTDEVADGGARPRPTSDSP